MESLAKFLAVGRFCQRLSSRTGASEGPLHTIGGVIIDRACGASEYFACHVPDTLAKTWQSQMKHIIGPVELYGHSGCEVPMA